MPKTSIEWTDASVNPIRARDKATGAEGHWCVKISPGCKNCYASRTQPRLRMHAYEAGNRDKIEVYLDPKRFDEVLRRRIPTKWFWADMTDLFGDWVPDEWIDECLAVMTLTPDHTHQVLTKRADRARRYFDGAKDRVSRRAARLWEELSPPPLRKRIWHRAEEYGRGADWWPLPNVWLGVSVENQAAADERIPLLLQTPAAVRWISAEPLLERIDIARYLKPTLVARDGRRLQHPDPAIPDTGGTWEFGLDWCVGGFESGPGARPGHLGAARSLRDQVVGAGKAFFWKQNGEYLPVEGIATEAGGVRFVPGIGLDGIGKMLRWDGEAFRSGAKDELAKSFLRPGTFAVKVGKKAAGRLLDGVEWSQFPEVTR